MTEPSSSRRKVWAGGLVLVIAIAVITAVAVHRQHGSARGASTARTAATLFVGAINSGSGSGAAAISCDSFAADARSAARSGADPGISFSLGAISITGDGATAVLNQVFDVGGSTQDSQHTLTLQKTDGLWLVCGQN